MSAQKAYASQLSLPTPDAPVRASLAAGVAIAFGLKQIAKISTAKFKGSAPTPAKPSGGGGGSGGSSSSSRDSGRATPNFSLFGTQNAGGEVAAGGGANTTNNISVQSTVSVEEINSVQNKVATIERRNTL
jgi:hypothetical protein